MKHYRNEKSKIYRSVKEFKRNFLPRYYRSELEREFPYLWFFEILEHFRREMDKLRVEG